MKTTKPELELAKGVWSPHHKEKEALAKRTYVAGLGRVDQIWEFLSEKHGQVIAVDAPHVAHPECFVYSQLARRISIAAASFSFFGIQKNNVVALFAENSPRWLIADQGLMRAGAMDAVRGASAPVEELHYILQDANADALVVQDSQLLSRLALNDAQRSRLRLIVQLNGDPCEEGVMGWEEFLEIGKGKKAPAPFKERGLDSAESVIATILYTSGTTGRPKGVPLSHANLLHQMKSLACVAHPPVGSSILSVLPIWHAYERSAEYYFFSCGCTQSYTNIKYLKSDLPRVRPIVMVTVPRLWEAVKQGFDDAVRRMPQYRQTLLKAAIANSTSQQRAVRRMKGFLIEPVQPLKRLKALLEVVSRWPMHILAVGFLWPKVLKQLCGGKLLFPINGGGAIAPHVDAFFEALGLEMLVGYGLTETSPVVSCRRPWKNIRGTAGYPLPDTELKIIDLENGSPMRFRQKGRVMVRGPQVMNGYLGRPQATAMVLDEEGWFDTGDIGMLLPDGSLVLTGRAKDTIVLSTGENIEPAPLEEALLASPLLEQVMLVGQDERQLGALVVPVIDAILPWAAERGLHLSSDLKVLSGNKNLRAILRKEINSLLMGRKGSRSEERVIGIALVDPFTIENGLLTQTLKQRRDKISSRDSGAISSIYGR